MKIDGEIVEHRLVDALDPELRFGLHGWQVIESWEEQVPVRLHTEELVPAGTYAPTHAYADNYCPTQGMQLASVREELATHRLLLLGKTRETVVAERDILKDQVAQQNHEIRELEKAQKALEKQLVEEDLKVEAARNLASGSRARAEEAERRNIEERKSLEKMERHLAAVREQIGAKEFDRIVKEIDKKT